MQTQTIAEFRPGDGVEGFFAVAEAHLLTSSRGSAYIRMTLRDASGSISGNMWDATPEIFASIDGAEILKVRGEVETYRGATQLKVTALRPVDEAELDATDFLPSSPLDMAEMTDHLRRTIDEVGDEDYRRLLAAIFADEAFVARFARAPAARENHHAYLGGLLEHTLNLVDLAEAFCRASRTPMNRDLLVAGALLHDMGKVEELRAGASIDYTDAGKLIGHLTLGALRVARCAEDLPDFPEEKKLLLLHMILSHHGQREYGSPVLPAIPEALALHHLDNLDAKTVAARRLIDEDPSSGDWTARSWMLDTKLYKRSLDGDAHESPDEPDADARSPEEEIPAENNESPPAPAPAPPPNTGTLF